MIDMSSWVELRLDVISDLRLDPENVRLEIPGDSSESIIIQDLFANEKALDLVKAIAKVGYFTHELPIAVMRQSKYFVVEGNRRLAALKAIQNPYLVPAYKSQIENLVRLIPTRDVLREIAVMVAPSQEDANELIAALHTGTQRVGWSRVRQAAFFDAQLEANMSLEELVARYPTIDVRAFARRSSILRLFRSVEYQDSELSKYIRSGKFPLTILERLYTSPEFQELAGICIDSATTRATANDPEHFAMLAEKIIGDVRYKRVNTRDLNKVTLQSFQDYLEELRSLDREDTITPRGHVGGDPEEPPSEQPETRTPQSDLGNDNANFSSQPTSPYGVEPANSDPGQRAVGPNPAKRPQPPFLNIDGLVPWPEYPELATVFNEVGRIRFRDFPNATHDLLRTVLEKVIKAYAHRRQAPIPIKGRGSFVQLKDCLDWLVSDFDRREECKSYRSPAKVLKDGISGSFGLYTASQDYMNAINHNFLSAALPHHVEGAWTSMRPVIKFMFEDGV
jgi:hypothetical protein